MPRNERQRDKNLDQTYAYSRVSWLTLYYLSLTSAEMIDASGELEGLPATFAGCMPRLSVTRDKPDKIRPPEPGLAAANPADRIARSRGRRGADPDQPRPRRWTKGSGAGRRGR